MSTTPTRRLFPHPLAFVCLLFFFALSAFAPIESHGQKQLHPMEIEDRLSRLDPEDRRVIEPMQCILRPGQFQELMAMGSSVRQRRWIDDYWELRDPIFTTDENENRLEHERRVEHARMYFLKSGPPGWDQRGEVYIRYGHPTFMATIPEEVNSAGVTPPGELWFYMLYDMYVRFEDPYRRGDYSYFQEHVYATGSLRMRRIGRPIDAANVTNLLPPEITLMRPYEQFMKRTRRFYEVIEATPSSYKYDFSSEQIPFAFSIDNFRGGDSINRVDVNLEFMPDQTPIERGPDAREYVAMAVFRDRDGATLESHESTIRVATREGASEMGLVPVQMSFSVPPGFYFASVTLHERAQDRLTSYRSDLACPDMDTRLAVSDIVTASVIEDATAQSPFNRGALRVVPHPYRRYRKPAVIPIYFEVYNLTPDDRGVSTYDIEYEVEGDKPQPRGFWGSLFREGSKMATSSRFESSAYGTHDVLRLNLSTESLWVGTFTLRIAVEDKIAGAKTTQDVTFTILE